MPDMLRDLHQVVVIVKIEITALCLCLYVLLDLGK